MKEAIIYYYNCYDTDIRLINKVARFSFKGEEFALVPLERNPKELKNLIEYNNELRKMGFNSHQIIANRFGGVISQINNCNYVLLQLMGQLNEKIDIFDIIENSKKYRVNLKNSSKLFHNWADLWQRKVDYLETQIKLIEEKNQKVIGNFSYYIGLAENAILYYKGIDQSFEKRLSLAHRRVFSPNIWLNYGNPLTFVFDVPCRDYAEFIKSSFFYESVRSGYENFNLLLKTEKMDKHMLELLISRLLFPSYYFDVFEEIVLNKSDEKKLLIIVEKAGDFERFLRYCFYAIKNTMEINEIPLWLL